MALVILLYEMLHTPLPYTLWGKRWFRWGCYLALFLIVCSAVRR